MKVGWQNKRTSEFIDKQSFTKLAQRACIYGWEFTFNADRSQATVVWTPGQEDEYECSCGS